MTVRSAVPVLTPVDSLPTPPKQSRSIEKRRKLLEAARALFGDHGYDATSIEDISARAGIAVGAFYTYFRSKQQLLVVLMNELVHRLAAANLSPPAAAGTDVRLALRRFVTDMFHTDLEYFGVIRAWEEATLTDADLSTHQRAIESWTQARILRVFQVLHKHPDARPGRDLPTFARMMDRHFWSLLAQGPSMSRRQFDRQVRIAADVIFHYLFVDSTTRRKR